MRFSRLPPYSSVRDGWRAARGSSRAGSRGPCAARAGRSPRARARRAAATKSSRTRSMSARSIARGACQPASNGDGRGRRASARRCPSAAAAVVALPGRATEPLRPACASCMPILAPVCACTKSTMRCQASACASFQIPVQPCVMRPSALTSVVSVITRPAPPTARLPRCTRCQSSTVPSTAEYWHIGRDHDAVGQLEPARAEGREHRRRRACRRAAGVAPAPRATSGADALDERRVARAAGCRR